MKKILFLLLSVALLVGCTTGKTQKPSFTGTWYASQYGCRSVVHFNEDSTITISSEANSAANMTVGYVVSPQADGYHFDLKMGMENRGIALFDGADHLQIGIVFGPEQYAPRPQKYEDANSTHGNLMLDLYRDPTKVISVLDTKVEAPAEAAIPFERNKRLG